MKKVFLILICFSLSFHLNAQWFLEPAKQVERNYTIGAGFQAMNFNELSKLLTENGYPALENGVRLALLRHERVRDERYCRSIEFAYSDLNMTDKTTRPSKLTYFRFKGDFGFRVFQAEQVALFTQTGLSYSLVNLRLYNKFPDSINVSNYLAQAPDAKRMMSKEVALNIGLNLRYCSVGGMYMGVMTGYHIGLGEDGWEHDLGQFYDSPSTSLNGFYTQIHVGFSLLRIRNNTTLIPQMREKAALL